MQAQHIPYSQTGYFTKAVIDYLNGIPELKPFYQFAPEETSVADAITNRNKFPADRNALVTALLAQHRNYFQQKLIPETEKNIRSLEKGNTFTVTTAHQPNLFLGPMYLIYKIISAVNAAAALNKKFPSNHFVPVYWMGSEDHDKAELNHIHLFGKTVTWDTKQTGAFGRMNTGGLNVCIEEVASILGDSEAAKNLIQLIRDCYGDTLTIAEATKKFLYHLFADKGLVIVDGDDAQLKKLFIPVMEEDLFRNKPNDILSESNKVFEKLYPLQIHLRNINFFFLDANLRERIEKQEGRWKVLNTTFSFSESELKALLQAHPEKFSPNVVLRPLYQETVLPNVVFIGGGAEVTYFLQLKKIFDALQVAFPVVLLRNSALLIDAGTAQRMKKLGIAAAELFYPAEKIIEAYVSSRHNGMLSLDEERSKVTAVFETAKEKARTTDVSLVNSFEAEKTRALKQLEQMEERLVRAAKKKEETAVQQIRALKEKLFPQNTLQERYDNALPYFMQGGLPFMEELFSALQPFEKQFVILTET